MASFCAVSNCYFLAVICFVKQIRDWKYFPIAFQSMCDLLSCGFVLFWKSMQDVIVRHGTSDGDYFLSGRFATWYRSTWLGDDPPVLKCVQEFILDIANDYSTAPCLLIMAAERYLMVCQSGWSKRILTNNKRRIICACLTGKCFFLHFFHVKLFFKLV